MTYYKSLLEYVQVLEREGLLFRVNKPINKDTEMHPFVRWQFRGLGEEHGKLFTSMISTTPKARNTTFPFSSAGSAGSQRIYALGLMCKEEEVEQIWTNALEKPIDPIVVEKGEVQEVVYEGEALIRSGGLYNVTDPDLHAGIRQCALLNGRVLDH